MSSKDVFIFGASPMSCQVNDIGCTEDKKHNFGSQIQNPQSKRRGLIMNGPYLPLEQDEFALSSLIVIAIKYLLHYSQ